jgi:hypothetical protein
MPSISRSLLLILFLVLFALDGTAKPKPRKAKKKTRSQVTLPVDLGIGPTTNWFTGPVGDDQGAHYGLKLELAAIIDKATIKQNRKRIPKKYRNMALKMDEIVYRPFWWLPDSLLISPKVRNAYAYGVTLRPVGLGLSFLNNSAFKLTLGAGLVLTYAYLGNDQWMAQGYQRNTMHFLRPGADAKAELLLKLSRSFLVSVGWDSHFYPPQRLGAGITDGWGAKPLDHSLWHNGQGFLLLHFRFPYSTTLP